MAEVMRFVGWPVVALGGVLYLGWLAVSHPKGLHGVIGIIVACLLAAAWVKRPRQVRRTRRSRGFCPSCGYDIRRKFDGGCPECGWRRIA